jgi:hypothetical protein
MLPDGTAVRIAVLPGRANCTLRTPVRLTVDPKIKTQTSEASSERSEDDW